MKLTLSLSLSLGLLAASAAAAPSELVRRDTVTCGSTSYSAAQVSDAAEAACDLVQTKEKAGSSTYPHQYRNFEGFEFKGYKGPFQEFPILSSGKEYTGGRPGPDRVVITSDCREAGVITHSGAKGNAFVACESQSNGDKDGKDKDSKDGNGDGDSR
jgi:hypothetical protein